MHIYCSRECMGVIFESCRCHTLCRPCPHTHWISQIWKTFYGFTIRRIIHIKDRIFVYFLSLSIVCVWLCKHFRQDKSLILTFYWRLVIVWTDFVQCTYSHSHTHVKCTRSKCVWMRARVVCIYATCTVHIYSSFALHLAPRRHYISY